MAPTACRHAVSGSLSPSCPECFSPFPRGTGSLSVFRECLALPDGAGGFGGDFAGPRLLRASRPSGRRRVRGSHPLWPCFPARSALAALRLCGPYNPAGASTPAVWARPRSLAATCGVILIFPSSGYLDVSVPRAGPALAVPRGLRGGFSHWGIRTSMALSASVRLFAALRALRLLRKPRHPLHALACMSPHAAPAAYELFALALPFLSYYYPVCQCTPRRYRYLRMWRISGSNRWPPACKAGALAS